jgi:hypothetical protein
MKNLIHQIRRSSRHRNPPPVSQDSVTPLQCVVRVLEQIVLLANAWTLYITGLLKYYNISGLQNYKGLPWTRIGMASVKSLYSCPFKMVVGQCMMSMLLLSMALVETSTRLEHVTDVLRVMKRSSGCPIYCRMIFRELGSSHLGILHNGLQAKEFARSLLQALRQLSDKVACTISCSN